MGRYADHLDPWEWFLKDIKSLDYMTNKWISLGIRMIYADIKVRALDAHVYFAQHLLQVILWFWIWLAAPAVPTTMFDQFKNILPTTNINIRSLSSSVG